MTDTYWARDLLQAEWDTSSDPIPGEGDIREPIQASVPKFKIEGGADRRAEQADTQPLVWLNGGGSPSITPRSVGYRDEEVENEITVELVYQGTRKEFVGLVENDYGGITGETKRVFDKHRTGYDGSNLSIGDPGYDIITYDMLRDESDRRGAGIWTAELTVRFITFARDILQ